MHWSALVVLALGAAGQSMDVAHTTQSGMYSSYTQAWHAAHDAERPMLVILNPAPGEGRRLITEEELRSDPKVETLLNDYVVAVIDTGTEHGQKVHELFGNAPLPRVVVIDKQQKKQIFRTSDELSSDRLANILNQHKSGEVAPPVLQVGQPVNSSCPNCQKRYTF